MTFQSQDILPYSSTPIELYWFTSTQGLTTTHYYYTSSDTSFHDGTQLWVAMPMNHDEFDISSLLERIGLTINVAQDNPVARLFFNPSPPAPISIKLYQAMRDDPEHQVIFVGTVKNCTFEDEEARLICESVQTAIKKIGLQRAHSRSCNHILYETSTCKVTASSFQSTGTISSFGLNNTRILITPSPTRPADWFTTGEVLRTNGDRMMIINDTVVGSQHTLDLLRPLPGIANGESLTLYAGCKRTYDVCQGKFGNQANFGGFPYAPITNPFETGFIN